MFIGMCADPELTAAILMLQIVDEGASPFTEVSAKRFGGPDGQNGIADPDDFSESQLKHSINGGLACAATNHSWSNLADRVQDGATQHIRGC
jgi:hypothetical protein